MTKLNRSVFTGLAAAFLAIPALAAPLASGLKPGQSVTPFHPKHVAGPLAGTTNCFPCTFQNRPQVQAWINSNDTAAVLPLAKNLSKAMQTHKSNQFKALVVFLATKENAPAMEASVLKASKTPGTEGVGMAVLPKTDEAVKAYQINTAANVKNTVIVYKDWKVTDKFVNLKADAKGLSALNTAIASAAK